VRLKPGGNKSRPAFLHPVGQNLKPQKFDKNGQNFDILLLVHVI
jgi:hypothetical protein